MGSSRRKGSGRTAAAAAAQQQWKVGDLVLAKMRGFPAWPAMVPSWSLDSSFFVPPSLILLVFFSARHFLDVFAVTHLLFSFLIESREEK